MVNSAEHSMLQILNFKVATLIDRDEEAEQFNELIDDFIKDENVPRLVRGLKTIIRKPARLQLFDDVRRVVPLRMQMEYNLLVPYTSNRTRNVRLLRRGPPASYGFGFSIRGGREHGTGFFVSAVDLNSEAHHQGLRIGDQIVRINGFSVEDAIHQEVLHLIQSYNHLNLKVRSVGMIPVKDSDFVLADDDLPAPSAMPVLARNVSEPLLRNIHEAPAKPPRAPRTSLPQMERRGSLVNEILSRRGSLEAPPPSLAEIGRSTSLTTFNKKHDPLTWRMVDDKQTPPATITTAKPKPLIRTVSEGSILEGPSTYDEARDVKLFLDTSNHTSLGVSICKGNEQRPGIFVQSTREGGLAWEAGLATGDQIIDCNGVNFENIVFDQAVRVMKGSKQLDLLVRKGSGLELLGESSGYNSSSSSLNGDGGEHSSGSKRLSLITEDPGEEGERSRSNSRRGVDDALETLAEHAETSSQERSVQKVSAQVHREDDVHTHYPLTHSSSDSSTSSLSSALSNEVKRRSQRREDELLMQRREEERRRRELAMKVVPEERRQKHAQQLMQEFQQVHRKMFTGAAEHHSTTLVTEERQDTVHVERFHHVAYSGETFEAEQNVSAPRLRPAPLNPRDAEAVSAALAAPPKQRRGVEMNSIDTLTLNGRQSTKPKPPAVYFGAGASSKSQPGVVTISEYPRSEKRAAPSRLDFIASSTTNDSDLASELHSTLSRSNLRQLSEPVQAPPPPPLAPPSPPMSPVMNGKKHEEPQQPLFEMKRVKTKVNAINAFRRTQSPPPVIALKPLAVPYTELVTMKNQQLFNPSYDPSPPPPSSPPPAPSPAPALPPNSGRGASFITDALSNKVTIKFPNGTSASTSAGARQLAALSNAGILKHGHPGVVHHKTITFGEM